MKDYITINKYLATVEEWEIIIPPITNVYRDYKAFCDESGLEAEQPQIFIEALLTAGYTGIDKAAAPVNLRAARLKKGMSQNTLAKFCGVERTTITQIERDKNFPSVQLAQMIGKALNVEWWQLFPDLTQQNDNIRG